MKTNPKILARNTVARAIRNNQIAPPSQLKCAECDNPAYEYHHHKGYEKEHRLDVVPLCLDCHVATYRHQYRHSPETLEKMSQAHTRRYQDPAEREKARHKTPEGIERIRAANRGLPQSPETRQKRSDALKKAWERRRNQS